MSTIIRIPPTSFLMPFVLPHARIYHPTLLLEIIFLQSLSHSSFTRLLNGAVAPNILIFLFLLFLCGLPRPFTYLPSHLFVVVVSQLLWPSTSILDRFCRAQISVLQVFLSCSVFLPVFIHNSMYKLAQQQALPKFINIMKGRDKGKKKKKKRGSHYAFPIQASCNIFGTLFFRTAWSMLRSSTRNEKLFNGMKAWQGAMVTQSFMHALVPSLSVCGMFSMDPPSVNIVNTIQNEVEARHEWGRNVLCMGEAITPMASPPLRTATSPRLAFTFKLPLSSMSLFQTPPAKTFFSIRKGRRGGGCQESSFLRKGFHSPLAMPMIPAIKLRLNNESLFTCASCQV